ncbi:MAG: Uma2 family endonuclease [Coleofasciculaceae cyanobacterium SM2_1_6]|nr:Uma2 family endonuclease [Coleofasciculaceae cyanobacterium SM2_1_6]
MLQTLPKTTTFEEFLEWKPEGGLYELHNGVIFEMHPIGKHEEINGFLSKKLNFQFEHLNLPYIIPRQALVKIIDQDSAYFPDVLVINQGNLDSEPLWKKFSTVTQAASIPLVIEVVSTNWQDDYAHKLVDYEILGIPEYWIIDYLGLGGRRYIGNPKQPTISIYYLVEDEYQISQFRGDEVIVSPTFPELNLTAHQIFTAG